MAASLSGHSNCPLLYPLKTPITPIQTSQTLTKPHLVAVYMRRTEVLCSASLTTSRLASTCPVPAAALMRAARFMDLPLQSTALGVVSYRTGQRLPCACRRTDASCPVHGLAPEVNIARSCATWRSQHNQEKLHSHGCVLLG